MVINGKQYEITKKGKIILSLLLLCIILLIVLHFQLNKKEEIVYENFEIEETTNEKLYNAFQNNELTVDEYVLYSAYQLWDYNKLDDKYKTDSKYEMSVDIYNLVQIYNDEISLETKKYIQSKIQMKNVILGPEFDEISHVSSNINLMSNNIQNGAEILQRLDKYKLSPSGKFVVWYTNDMTNDYITDEQAERIVKYIDNYAEAYSKEYNVEFKWQKGFLNSYTEETYMNLLKKINSEDAETLYNAFPIYVVYSSNDAHSSNAKAYYASQIPEEDKIPTDSMYIPGIGGPMYNNADGIPVGPYIAIKNEYIYDEEDLEYIVAHELFHHYQYYICGDGEYLACKRALFISETSANWAAAKITSGYSFDIVSYISKSSETIDKIYPYYTASFLYNYENVVTNGKQKILDALNVGYALKFLYNNSDGKMPEVLNNLSKNNLINDYEHDGFKGHRESNVIIVDNYIKDNNKYIKNTVATINNMAMQYFGVDERKKFKFQNTSHNEYSYINVFTASYKGNNIYDNINVIYSQKFTDDIIIDFSKIGADKIFVSITNGSLTDIMEYKINETRENANVKLKNEINQHNIYVDGEKMEINNYSFNSRTFINIFEFCNTTNVCEVSYTDNSQNKILITLNTLYKKEDYLKMRYKYSLINEKNTKNFNSIITVSDTNFDLSQFNVDAQSCPTGYDSNGYSIPKCDSDKYYVPLRFVAQALGYEVIWVGGSNKRIDINSNFAEKLLKENNIRIVFSKEKIEIGDIVKNRVELKNNIEIKINEKYYVYTVNNENRRIFNSALFNIYDHNKFKITNELDSNSKTTFSILEPSSNIHTSGLIGIVTSITIPSDNDKDNGGVYPIVRYIHVSY